MDLAPDPVAIVLAVPVPTLAPGAVAIAPDPVRVRLTVPGLRREIISHRTSGDGDFYRHLRDWVGALGQRWG
jgi:hypothetical protein